MSLPHQGIKFYGKIHTFQCSFLTSTKFCYYNWPQFKENGLSKSCVSVLILTVFCIYTRLQIHVSSCMRWDRNLDPHRHSSWHII